MRIGMDAEILCWVGRLGAASAEHVAARFGIDRRVARKRLAALHREQMLECVEGPGASHGLYWASIAGLRCFGLERFGVWREGPEGVEYAWLVAQVAVQLGLGLPDWDVLSAREIVAIEADSGEQFASVCVRGRGHCTVYVPALALESPGGRVLPVEVQPALATVSGLVPLCRAWGRAEHVGRVYWLAPFGPGRAVRRAAREARASDRVLVLDVEDIMLLVASERAREEVIDDLL
jgi:hypothetical protein